MIYGIIADVHGNFEALSVVLKQLKDVDKIVCLGDIIGYGPEPNGCLQEIVEKDISAIAGNHEKAVLGELSTKWFNPRALAATNWTRDNLENANLDYIKQLPANLDQADFQAVHGSLRSPLEEYITSIAEAMPSFEMMSKPLCFVGHLHRPLFIAQKKDGNYDGRHLSAGDELLIDDYDKVIINPGAVGQPRDGDPRASYGLYNSKTKLFSLHRIDYDIKKTQEEMIQAGLPASLRERLQYGR